MEKERVRGGAAPSAPTAPDGLEARRAAVERSLLLGRLRHGAEVLGRLWKSGVRCRQGWAAPPCGCLPGERNPFCEAKARWTAILIDWSGGRIATDPSPFWVLEMMTVGQLEASGVPVRVRFEDGSEILFGGPRGARLRETWPTLFEASGRPRVDAVKSVARFQAMM